MSSNDTTTTTAEIFRGETGEAIRISPLRAGVAEPTAAYTVAQSTVELKESPGSDTLVTIPGTSLTFGTDFVDMTLAITDYANLPNQNYVGFLHLKNSTPIPSLDIIARFNLKILPA